MTKVGKTPARGLSFESMKDIDVASLRAMLSNQKLEPGSKQYERLKAISDRLGDLQEKDFQARQVKEEIDRALNGGGGSSLIDAFTMKSRRSDDD